ncbi:MAG: IS66 family transposase zinc-finger binding domain-containing protein, partial [Tannerella sp.]|nr:IS66 family transposase zinc-finger binding domain-containing protein [Tannerella sp.]
MEEVITILRSENERLRLENEHLCLENNQMLARIAEPETLVQRLMEEITFLKNGHNSKTGSTSPSHDIWRSNSISLRGKNDKKSGGQPGHKGHALFMKETPDEVKEHTVSYCSGCGTNLKAVSAELSSRRQEVEIPVIQPRYVEYRSMVKVCPCCGPANRGTYPDHIKGPVQYGTSVKSLASYLSVYQFLPYRRLCQFFSDLHSLPLSEGSVDKKDLFRRAIALKKRLGVEDYRHPPKEVAALEGELNELLKVDYSQFHPRLQ